MKKMSVILSLGVLVLSSQFASAAGNSVDLSGDHAAAVCRWSTGPNTASLAQDLQVGCNESNSGMYNTFGSTSRLGIGPIDCSKIRTVMVAAGIIDLNTGGFSVRTECSAPSAAPRTAKLTLTKIW